MAANLSIEEWLNILDHQDYDDIDAMSQLICLPEKYKWRRLQKEFESKFQLIPKIEEIKINSRPSRYSVTLPINDRKYYELLYIYEPYPYLWKSPMIGISVPNEIYRYL